MAIIDDELIDKMTFWDHDYSKSKFTFIDLIKVLLQNLFLKKVGAFALIDVQNKKKKRKD
uniref:Uncharacterized protein n=1 Tax=Rhizophagus irregularis (strain DAOM 181602 / DAOM 197198 / MUCL 43194) TaxID=747089 RepID=U9UN80_RHIID